MNFKENGRSKNDIQATVDTSFNERRKHGRDRFWKKSRVCLHCVSSPSARWGAV